MTELQQREHQEVQRKATHPTWISVVRMYRGECGLSFDEARQRATNEFSRRGWAVPAIEQERIKKDAGDERLLCAVLYEGKGELN